MKTRLFASALAMAVLTAGFAPSDVEAKPKYKKIAKKIHKRHHKAAKHYYKHHSPYRYHHRHWDDWDDDYDRESFGIYTTPTGGLGFHYSESSGSYGYPYGYYPGYYY